MVKTLKFVYAIILFMYIFLVPMNVEGNLYFHVFFF